MPTLEQDVADTARHFYEWLVWYRRFDRPEGEDELTIQALADRIGVTRPTISQILTAKGQRAPDFKTLVGFARLVGLGYDAILGHPPLTPRGK